MTDLQSATATRTFTVTGMRCEGCEETIARHLQSLDGIEAVEADHHSGRVRVTYHLQRMRLDTVADALADLGYPPSGGWFERLRQAWTLFTEENQVANLKHVPHCCNKPPSSA